MSHAHPAKIRPAPCRARWGRRPRGALLAALLAVCGVLLLVGPPPAAAQDGSIYFLTIKNGMTDASGSGESLFNDFAASSHGQLQGDRAVKTRGIELDIYSVSRSSAGLGIGMEVLEYDHSFYFQDGEKVTLDAKGVLFTLKTFLRLGRFYPFLGFGLGNYYVNYAQAAALISFRDSPDNVYNMRAGVRMLFGRLGLLLEAGRTRARLPVETDIGRSTLELGGDYRNVGISWVF